MIRHIKLIIFIKKNTHPTYSANLVLAQSRVTRVNDQNELDFGIGDVPKSVCNQTKSSRVQCCFPYYTGIYKNKSLTSCICPSSRECPSTDRAIPPTIVPSGCISPRPHRGQHAPDTGGPAPAPRPWWQCNAEHSVCEIMRNGKLVFYIGDLKNNNIPYDVFDFHRVNPQRAL